MEPERMGPVHDPKLYGAWLSAERSTGLCTFTLQRVFGVHDFQLVSWLPVHMAAQIIVDNIDVFSPVMHLVHPNPVPWVILARVISQELNVKLVPYTRWLEALENSAFDPTSLPAIRILPHYRRSALAQGRKNREAFGMPHLVTSSDRREGIPPLGEDEVRNWLQYWRGESIF